MQTSCHIRKNSILLIYRHNNLFSVERNPQPEYNFFYFFVVPVKEFSLFPDFKKIRVAFFKLP
ncbi:MAG: hypothetical protein CSA20_06625 [Deltaproteobacteria bacterium]|nr:MAG: hypothetical protein CSA20_06625 [Deltaproteobacteria bacterium]